MNFINPTGTLDNIQKNVLRQLGGYTRLPAKKIAELIELNNEIYRVQEKNKSDLLKKEKVEKLRERLKNNLFDKGLPVIVNLKFFMSKFDNSNEGMKAIIDEMRNIIFLGIGRNFSLKAGNKYYALNANTIDKLVNLLNRQMIDDIVGLNSDEELLQELKNVNELSIQEFFKTNKNDKNNNAFFKYCNNTVIDLRKYQIYRNWDLRNDDNCMLFALKNGGLSLEKQEKMKMLIKAKNIPTCELEGICKILEIQIQLKKKAELNKTRIAIFGKEYDEIYKIGSLDEHAFLIEDTNITRYALEHYNEICHLPNFTKIANKKMEKDKKKLLDSFEVITILLEQKEKLLCELVKSDLTDTSMYKRVENVITNLNYEPRMFVNYNPIIPKEVQDKVCLNIFYDFETYKKSVFKRCTLTDENKEIITHVPYLCCYVNDDTQEKRTFYGEDCGLKMLFSIKSDKHINLIAHNGGKYDANFLLRYFYDLSSIEKGSKYMSINGKFNKQEFTLKDSLLLISSPLSSFPEMFNIKDTIKEVISYEMYDKTNCIERNYIPISMGVDWIIKDGKDVEQFLQNIERWGLNNNGVYSCIEYSAKYCSIDCEILMKGYNTFKEWMLKLVKINIDNILTIASLAHKYFINEGCFAGVNEISGIAQQFIQKCVVGGRTMCSENKMSNNSKNILDFDAVSLYPSAMCRMDGYLKGLPKVLTNLEWNDIKHYDGLFLEIKIKKIKNNLNFPLISVIDENGVRQFSNDVEDEIIFIDKIALEDAINFQGLEFSIIRGYYFDEGFNNKINKVIRHVFDERKKLQSQKNPAEIVYKLIMNSAYGKTIMKEIENDIKFFNTKEEMDVFLSRNYNWIQEFEQLQNSNKWRVKVMKTINNHFNIAHVGVSILSWSKRIMNEVMCLAEEQKIKMYYQDTDSIHLNQGDELILGKAFYEKYNRVLIGEDMGQFHSDFKMKGCSNVYSRRSIFLGKKSYIDELVGLNKDGSEKIDYHIRMKGIPNSVIKYTAKKLDNDVFQLYERLHSGWSIKFDLTEGGKNTMNLKIHKSGIVETLSHFERIVKF